MPECNVPVYSNDYADFIIRHGYRDPEDFYEATGTRCVDFVNIGYAIVYTPRETASPISLSRYPYASIPKLYGLLDTTALESSGILPAFDQPALMADGHGVLIGIIDTGIDYTNPLFRNPDGTSRILRIWDQSIPSETSNRHPGSSYHNGNFNTAPLYGTFYSKDDLDLALDSENPLAVVPTTDTNGHGTFMAGVAAGNRIEQPTAFSGAAPKSSIMVVKVKQAKPYLRDFFLVPQDVPAFQENDIMMALRYLQDQARMLRMPIVIYLGMGTNQGSHDGSSPLGIQLQYQEGFYGLAFVTGAGNEVGFAHHYFADTSPEQVYEDVELKVAPGESGFAMEIWVREPELYTVGFISPSGEVINQIPFLLGNETRIPFRLNSTVITVNYQTTETGTGSQLIFIRFQKPAEGVWHIRVYPNFTITGQFHIWLPMRGFISEDTVFLKPDSNTTITDPGNAENPITVSTYNHTTGGIYIHSSRGYTRTGLIKPDIAAPGVDVQGPALTLPTGSRSSLFGGGTDEIRFTRHSGSSVAAAITAGAVADLFSWGIVDGNDPTLNSTSIRAMLIRGANRSSALTYPNREWGYGTLNLYRSLSNLY